MHLPNRNFSSGKNIFGQNGNYNKELAEELSKYKLLVKRFEDKMQDLGKKNKKSRRQEQRTKRRD